VCLCANNTNKSWPICTIRKFVLQQQNIQLRRHSVTDNVTSCVCHQMPARLLHFTHDLNDSRKRPFWTGFSWREIFVWRYRLSLYNMLVCNLVSRQKKKIFRILISANHRTRSSCFNPWRCQLPNVEVMVICQHESENFRNKSVTT
jgi:hypothetical protein